MSDLFSRESVPDSPRTALSPPPIAFSCRRRGGGGESTCLILAGELDLAAQSDFRHALDEALADSARVLLNLSALKVIDSAGLFVLFAAAERRGRGAAAMTLRNPRGQVKRMLDLVGLPDGVFVSDEGNAESIETRVAA